MKKLQERIDCIKTYREERNLTDMEYELFFLEQELLATKYSLKPIDYVVKKVGYMMGLNAHGYKPKVIYEILDRVLSGIYATGDIYGDTTAMRDLHMLGNIPFINDLLTSEGLLKVDHSFKMSNLIDLENYRIRNQIIADYELTVKGIVKLKEFCIGVKSVLDYLHDNPVSIDS